MEEGEEGGCDEKLGQDREKRRGRGGKDKQGPVRATLSVLDLFLKNYQNGHRK
jgi:hypothetical protein